MFKRAITHSELFLAAVFSNDERMRSKNRSATDTAEKIQRAGIFVLRLVRRIKIDQINGLREFRESLQHGSNATVLQRKAPADLQCGKILSQGCKRCLGVFGEPDMRSTTAYRFNSNGACSRVEIDEAAAIEARRKDVEEGFAKPIARRSGLHATWSG